MTPIRMSKIESATCTVLVFTEAFNRQDIAGMAQLLTDDCAFESSAPAPEGAAYAGKEAIAQFYHRFFRESPDAHLDI